MDVSKWISSQADAAPPIPPTSHGPWLPPQPVTSPGYLEVSQPGAAVTAGDKAVSLVGGSAQGSHQKAHCSWPVQGTSTALVLGCHISLISHFFRLFML
jgi:hypothetical protein